MEQWDKVAIKYDKMMGETGDIPHRKLFNPAIRQFLGDISGKVILDAGCGNGYWTRNLAISSKEVIGIDSSKELIEIAKRKRNPSNISFQFVDLTARLPFEDQYFDLIVSNMVLHYLPDIKSVARELFRITKKKGKIIFSIAHPKYESAKNKNLRMIKTRTRFFTETLGGSAKMEEYYEPLSGYKKAFKEAGFKFIGLKEPLITEELIKDYPRYEGCKGLPRAAIFYWQKT